MTYKPARPIRKFRPAPAVRSFGKVQPELADRERWEFVQALDAAKLDLDEWETGFIKSCIKINYWSDKMRTQVDRLMNKYRGRVKWGNNPLLAPVRSKERVAFVPDDAAKLLSPGGGR